MEIERGDEVATTAITDRWLEEHREMYNRGTRHPFVLSIRDGTVDFSSFTRWLSQDYIFVREFVPFAAGLLLKAWKDLDDDKDIEVILGALASLIDEIAWFQREASKWDVSLTDIPPQKSNQDYCRFLQSMMLPEIDYTTAIVVFWAIETVYQHCFSICLEKGSNTPPELMETCHRWGNAGFGQYCHSLWEIANRRLKVAPEDVVRQSEVAFVHVLEHEVSFWNMSIGEI